MTPGFGLWLSIPLYYLYRDKRSSGQQWHIEAKMYSSLLLASLFAFIFLLWAYVFFPSQHQPTPLYFHSPPLQQGLYSAPIKPSPHLYSQHSNVDGRTERACSNGALRAIIECKQPLCALLHTCSLSPFC